MRRILLILALALAGVLGVSAPAIAQPPATISAVQVQVPMAPPVPTPEAGEVRSVEESRNLLPVNRWADGTSRFHSRAEGGVGGFFKTVQRDGIAASMMAAGDFAWSLTASFTSQAVSMDLWNHAGELVDTAAASIGGGLLATAGGAIIVILVFYSLISGFRSGRGFRIKELVGKVAVLAVAGVVVTGAQSPGSTFSPSNIVRTGQDIVTAIASAPSLAVGAGLDAVPVGRGPVAPTDAYSCQAYVETLRETYAGGVGGTSDGEGGGWALPNAASYTPLLISRMWENSGMQAWKVAQFGANNPYSDLVYCRMLENNVGISYADQATVLSMAGAPVGVPTPDNEGRVIANAPIAPVTTGDLDMSMVAWAACAGPNPRSSADFPAFTDRTGRQVRPNPENLINSDESEGAGCAEWWGNPFKSLAKDAEGAVDSNTSMFDWEADQEHLAQETGADTPEHNFISTLHGENPSTAGASAIAYLLSSVAIFLVFGMIALSIIAAKTLLLGMAIALAVIGLVAALPKVSTRAKLAQVAKPTLVTMVFIGLANVLFSFVGLLTDIVGRIGEVMFAAGTIPSITWGAVAPVAAVITIVIIFRMMGQPNPFRPSSALAYAKVGADQIAGMRNVENRVKGAVTGAGRSALGSVKPAFTGGQGRATAAASAAKGGGKGSMSANMPKVPVGSATRTGAASAMGKAGVAGGAAAAMAGAAATGLLGRKAAGKAGSGVGAKAPVGAAGADVPVVADRSKAKRLDTLFGTATAAATVGAAMAPGIDPNTVSAAGAAVGAGATKAATAARAAVSRRSEEARQVRAIVAPNRVRSFYEARRHGTVDAKGAPVAVSRFDAARAATKDMAVQRSRAALAAAAHPVQSLRNNGGQIGSRAGRAAVVGAATAATAAVAGPAALAVPALMGGAYGAARVARHNSEDRARLAQRAADEKVDVRELLDSQPAPVHVGAPKPIAERERQARPVVRVSKHRASPRNPDPVQEPIVPPALARARSVEPADVPAPEPSRSETRQVAAEPTRGESEPAKVAPVRVEPSQPRAEVRQVATEPTRVAPVQTRADARQVPAEPVRAERQAERPDPAPAQRQVEVRQATVAPRQPVRPAPAKPQAEKKKQQERPMVPGQRPTAPTTTAKKPPSLPTPTRGRSSQ